MENTQIQIPEGWKKNNFGNLIIEKPKSQLKVSDATGFGNYPFFTSGEAILLHHKKQIEGENIFLATGGVANVKYHNGEVSYSTDTYALTTDNTDLKYLYYFLLNKLYYINSNYFLGSGLKHLQKKDLKNHSLVLPKSTTEQKKIAEILSKVDTAIEQTQNLIAKYQRIKTGLMQDLLTKGIDENGNIRSEETHEFKDSELGRIPVEWDCSKIDDITYVTKLSGFEFTKHFKYNDEGEIIALRALNIKGERIILDNVQRISKDVSDYLVRSKLYKGDVLITYIGAYIGDVAQVQDNDKFHLAPNIAKIVSGKKIVSDFLELSLRTELLKKQIKSLTTSTANPSLTMGQIRKMFLIYPKNKIEQELIVIKMYSLKNSIETIKDELAKLQSIKTGLMQDLLSGKKRVSNLIKENAL